MNTKIAKIISIVSLISASFNFASAEENVASGKSVRLPDLQVYGLSAMPVPTNQSIPKVPGNLVGSTVVFKFTVSEKGKTQGVDTQKPLHSIYYPRDRDFAVQMINALKHWKFAPAIGTDGQPKAVKILMPITVVERDGAPAAIASLSLADKQPSARWR